MAYTNDFAFLEISLFLRDVGLGMEVQREEDQLSHVAWPSQITSLDTFLQLLAPCRDAVLSLDLLAV